MPTKPPLGLAVEITSADGTTTRWGPESSPDKIPQGITFRTSQGNGFADSNCTLPRRIDRDYVDLNLLDSQIISGLDGSVAYEGRVNGLPRSLNQSHSVTVQATGWMAHTRDRKMSEVYVDRDLSHWGQISNSMIGDLLAINYNQQTFSVVPDETGLPALLMTIAGAWTTSLPYVDAMYDAGPNNKIASIYYDFLPGSGVDPTNPNWYWSLYAADNDRRTSPVNAGNLRAASGAGYYTPTVAHRYAWLDYSFAAAGGSQNTNYNLAWRYLAAYGDHGLTPQGAAPGGILASDAIKHLIGKYCPLLNTSGVQATTYPIPHLAFRDRIDPYDALLEINKYHLWQLGVYDNRTLHYGPVDMSDYDWEVRLSDPGVTIDLQGDNTDVLANGIVVTYTNLSTGTTSVLTPDDDPTLADVSPDNPVNQHGLKKWTEITLSTPTDATGAAQIGRIALAEFNQAKGPGTINVTGHIRDRQGHWTQVWKVRAGDRIAITDHPNDRPRLVVETDYSHDTKTISIAVDSQFKRLDAVLDRLGTAISASNLTNP